MMPPPWFIIMTIKTMKRTVGTSMMIVEIQLPDCDSPWVLILTFSDWARSWTFLTLESFPSIVVEKPVTLEEVFPPKISELEDDLV